MSLISNLNIKGLSPDQIITLSGKTKLEDLQSYINTINEIKNIDWESSSFVPTADFVSFDVESAKLYAKALSDVDDKQATLTLLLSTQGLSNAQIQQTLAQRGLNTEQQYEAMLNAGLLKSRQKLTNVQVQSTLQSVLGSKQKNIHIVYLIHS